MILNFTHLRIVLFVLIGCFSLSDAAQAQNPIYVRGNLIQIYRATGNGPVYPNGQRSAYDDFFDDNIPNEIDGREFATTIPEDGVGPMQVSGDNGRYVIAAVHHKNVVISGWMDLNVSFTMRGDATPRNTYNLYRLNITETGKWYDIPQQEMGADAPTLLFADQGDVKWDDYTPLDGNFIVEKAPSASLIADPVICVLPNGNLMAMAWGPAPKRQFRSTDGGLTWEGYGPDYPTIRFATPFTHKGELYMLSSFRPGNDRGIFIKKSLDNGETWETYDGKDYVVLNSELGNGALNCPSPVVVAQGRIWRAIGDNGPDDFPNLGFMSASVDADLMDPASWTYTNMINRGSSQGRYGRILKPWEPCAVATRNGGYPVMLARTEPADARNGDSSPLYKVTSTSNLIFDGEVVDLLGAKDKFCVRYDPVSDRYWALANTAAAAEYGGGESIWSRRSRLVLQSSVDLKEWHVEKILAQASDSRFSGYQYPYFVFDGDDIVAAIRTAAENEDGMAKRAHDANFLTFLRVENYRDTHTERKAVTFRKGWEMLFADAKNTNQGDSPKLYESPNGKSNEWEQISLDNNHFVFFKLGTNLALTAGSPGNPITLEPYDQNNQNQQWGKVKADFRHFALESRSNSGYVIDGGSSSNGQILTLQISNTNSENQRWEIEPTRTQVNVRQCAIIPYLNINNEGWNSLGEVTVNIGDEVWFGPQSKTYGPSSSGWNYTGPDGFTSEDRSLNLENIQPTQQGTYTVINVDQDGCTSRYSFEIRVAPSQVPIIVDGNGFVKRIFKNETAFFTNRTYLIENAPETFVGFEVLASEGKLIESGTITPLADGYVYVVAPVGGLTDWMQVPNSTFNYSDGTKTSVSIYQKAGTANTPIPIPEVTAFPGVSPIAITIDLSNVVTGNDDQKEGDDVVVFPNPTSSSVITSEEVKWSLLDVYGNKLKNGIGNTISLDNYSSGIYFLLMEGQSHRIIKQ